MGGHARSSLSSSGWKKPSLSTRESKCGNMLCHLAGCGFNGLLICFADAIKPRASFALHARHGRMHNWAQPACKQARKNQLKWLLPLLSEANIRQSRSSCPSTKIVTPLGLQSGAMSTTCLGGL